MASFYYGSGLTWTGYLQADSFVRDITGQIRKSGEANRHKISAQTREIIASNERLSHEFGRGFDAVNGTLEIGFNRLESALGNVEASIDSLHSDFNYNMGLVLDQLQIQNQLTFGILERLDAIHKTLEHPELTKAREFYNRGCERLSKGLLDKALEAFLKAEEKNDTDFFIQFQIGKLYLYGMDEDDNVIDLPKAEKHLRDAARYGKAEIAVMPEFKRWAGEALLHTSIACYAQANDQQINGDSAGAKEFIPKAFQLAQQACEIYPSLSESQYHLAKYAALSGDVEISVQSLEKAVTSDVNYCLKTEFDRDFDKMRPHIFDLFERMRVKMGKKACCHIQEYSQKYLADMVYLTDESRKSKEEIRNILSNAEIKINNNTIFDRFEALQILNQIGPTFLNIYSKFVEKYSDENIINGSISPDEKLIAASDGSHVTIWRVSDSKLILKLPGKFMDSFSPDGKLIATGDYETVKLWDVSDGKLILSLPGRNLGGKLASFSPDGKLIATWDNKAVKLFQISDGEPIHTLYGSDVASFSPDGKLIATGDHETVKLWQVSDGKLIQTLPYKYGLVFSPDGKLIATSYDQSVTLWKVSDGKPLLKLPVKYVFSFSPDGKLIATGDYETVKLWQVSDGKLIQTLNEKTFQKFSPTGNFIIASEGTYTNVKIFGRQVILKEDFNQQEHFGNTFMSLRKMWRQHLHNEKVAVAEQQKKSLQEERKHNGLCLVCGAKLSFFDKVRGRVNCSKHST